MFLFFYYVKYLGSERSKVFGIFFNVIFMFLFFLDYFFWAVKVLTRLHLTIFIDNKFKTYCQWLFFVPENVIQIWT